MSRGAPDYSNVRKEEFSIRLDDLAELAARLGSPVVFDRRGEVWFIETWLNGFTPYTNAYWGTNAIVKLDVDRYVTDGVSLLLKGGSDSFRIAQVLRDFPYLYADTFGIETSSYINDSVLHFLVQLEVYDGTYVYDTRMLYLPKTSTLQVWNSSGVYETVSSNLTIRTDTTFFSFFKLAIDVNNGIYLRALINGRLFDLSSIGLQAVSNATNPSIRLTLQCLSDTGVNGEIYVDNFLLTRGEV